MRSPGRGSVLPGRGFVVRTLGCMGDRRVVLVCGPPCAGKSTYIRKHAAPGALVLDQDELGWKGMQRMLARIHTLTGEVWVIRSAPGPKERATLARKLGVTEPVVLLCPPAEELERRAEERDHPGQVKAAIRAWLLKENGLAVQKSKHRSGSRAREVQRETFKVHGDLCWICGHGGAKESDHIVPLSKDRGQVLSVAGRRPAHGANGPCEVCGRKCNTERGARAADEVFVPKVVW